MILPGVANKDTAHKVVNLKALTCGIACGPAINYLTVVCPVYTTVVWPAFAIVVRKNTCELLVEKDIADFFGIILQMSHKHVNWASFDLVHTLSRFSNLTE